MCNQEKIPGLETDTPSHLIVCVSCAESYCGGGCGTSTTKITTSTQHTKCPCDETTEIYSGQYMFGYYLENGDGDRHCEEGGNMRNYTFQVYGTEEEAIKAKELMDEYYATNIYLYYDSNVYSFSALQNMHNVNDLPDPYT